MENGNPQKKKLQISSVISVFVFLADIYFIVNMKSNYAILGVAALATLFCILSTINAWTKWKEADSQRAEEHYVDIMKAEKSTHLVSQKSFQNLDEKLNFIGQKIMPLEKASSSNQQKIATMLENLMDGQKKVAKVTISRSKENATALMNSNDQLIQRMEEFQQSILDMKSEVLEKQDEIYNNKLQKMDENHKELVDKIQESTNMFQNLQRMDENQKELAEKIQESSELFRNLRRMDDNQKELVEKIQESTDLIKNIIEVIPDKIAQMPQLAPREPYPQNGFVVNETSSIGQEGLPEVAEEEALDGASKSGPAMEAESEIAEIPVVEAVETVVPEYAGMEGQEQIVMPEYTKIEELGQIEQAEPMEAEAEPIRLSEYSEMEDPEQMERPEPIREEIEPAATSEAVSADSEQEVTDLALQLEGMLQSMEGLEGEPEGLPSVLPEEKEEPEPMDGIVPEVAEEPEPMDGIVPEIAEEPEPMDGIVPEVAEEPESMDGIVPEVAEELPGAMAYAQGAETAGLPETISYAKEFAGKVDQIAVPETGKEEFTDSTTEPELMETPIEAANTEPVSEATQIEPLTSRIGAPLEEMPPILADAVSVPMKIPEEATGTQLQDALIPEQIPTVGSANGMMTPEDIAALLATTVEPEPEPEPEPIPAPFMGNGDGLMSPEEIAALIGNTTVEELPKMTDRIDDGIKPPLPDMSDPGKMLSPEDIASLIANM